MHFLIQWKSANYHVKIPMDEHVAKLRSSIIYSTQGNISRALLMMTVQRYGVIVMLVLVDATILLITNFLIMSIQMN